MAHNLKLLFLFLLFPLLLLLLFLKNNNGANIFSVKFYFHCTQKTDAVHIDKSFLHPCYITIDVFLCFYISIMRWFWGVKSPYLCGKFANLENKISSCSASIFSKNITLYVFHTLTLLFDDEHNVEQIFFFWNQPDTCHITSTD